MLGSQVWRAHPQPATPLSAVPTHRVLVSFSVFAFCSPQRASKEKIKWTDQAISQLRWYTPLSRLPPSETRVAPPCRVLLFCLSLSQDNSAYCFLFPISTIQRPRPPSKLTLGFAASRWLRPHTHTQYTPGRAIGTHRSGSIVPLHTLHLHTYIINQSR